MRRNLEVAATSGAFRALSSRAAEDEAMSFTDYHCKHCARTRAVETSRVAQSTFLRCDACFAISSLTLAERRLMIKAASPEARDVRARHRAPQAIAG
jgi:hypothetical protein